jgi:hypothetical protein
VIIACHPYRIVCTEKPECLQLKSISEKLSVKGVQRIDTRRDILGVGPSGGYKGSERGIATVPPDGVECF